MRHQGSKDKRLITNNGFYFMSCIRSRKAKQQSGQAPPLKVMRVVLTPLYQINASCNTPIRRFSQTYFREGFC